jgi:Uri superfamily endonuclease
MKGIYCLVIFLDKQARIKIGNKIGLFPKGYYCYVGSALNNLEKRIQRHYSNEKKLHWHIDYLLKHANIIGVKIKKGSRDECGLSRHLKNIGGKTVFKKFGSSDCRCDTHLFYFSKNP